MATTTKSGTTNGVVRAVCSPCISSERMPSIRRVPTGAARRCIVEMSAADAANVAPLTRNATASGATASRIAPIAGPTTTPRSCTVCRRALAGASRDSPTIRGSIAIAAGRSAVPAAEANAVRPITSCTGLSAATAAARASMSEQRRRSPTRSTVRRS